MLLTAKPTLQPPFGFLFDKTECEFILSILYLLRCWAKIWQTTGTYPVTFSTFQLFTQCSGSRS